MEYGIIASIDNVNAATLKDFVIILLALGGFAMAAWTTFRPQRPTVITPDPLRVEKLDKFATRDFCEMKHAEVARRLDGHDQDVRDLYAELKRDREDLQKSASVRSAAIYTKIDTVQQQLTQKIDDMPAQLIATLKNTGALK